MAATPSKPSPSNQNVATDTTDAAAAAAERAADIKASTETVVEATSKEPTYEDSEKSDHFVLSKGFLNQGDFEQALTTIEEGLEMVRAAVVAASSKAENDLYVSLHESLAPFHYLYGTTLLYSIEESTDDNQAMTMGGAEGGGEAENPDEVADDMQIAWENLDLARKILEPLVVSTESDKLKLDLAQILLREGDLQRLNGRYENAIQDYLSCLKFREGNPLLGVYDRKIADVHYNLGLNYLMKAAEDKELDEQSSEAPSMDPAAREAMRAEYRSKSFQHYLACSKTLCGQVAFLCNVEPNEFLEKAESDVPRFKSTGEEDDAVDHPKLVGMKLQSLRKHVGGLKPPAEHGDMFTELCQLLQEIQETVDEAKNSEEGVKQVSDMKAAISAAAAADTAGFGGEPDTDGATTTTGFGSATAATAIAAAQPIMAVKKKKKRPAEDSKLPAQEDSGTAKRSKDE